MRGILGCVVVMLSLASTLGCSRSASTPASGEKPAVVAPADEGKWPKFESELVHTNTLNGGTGGGSTSSTRYDDGKPFTAVESHETTIKGGAVTLKFKVAFVAHRGGKDVYKLTYTVANSVGSETKSSETAYDGKRTVLVEDQYCTIVLQPPSK